MRLMTRVFLALAAMLVMFGCAGGGGGGGNVNFTVNTEFPAFNADSPNKLAQARSLWVFLVSEGDNVRQWAGIVNRNSDLAETITKRMDVPTGSSYKVDVLAYSERDGTGSVVGQATITGQPVGSTVTIASL
jgi:hypothetical protein